MTCAMLILLAASRLPTVRRLMRAEAMTVGDHLQRLFQRWLDVPGISHSPSVAQSLRMIWDIHGFIQQEYAAPAEQQQLDDKRRGGL